MCVCVCVCVYVCVRVCMYLCVFLYINFKRICTIYYLTINFFIGYNGFCRVLLSHANEL